MASKSLINNNEPSKNTKSLVILTKQAKVARVGHFDVKENATAVMTKDEIELSIAKAVIPEESTRPIVHFEEFPSVLLDACNKAKVDFKVAKRGDTTTLNA